jgi:hypothetical protein
MAGMAGKVVADKTDDKKQQERICMSVTVLGLVLDVAMVGEWALVSRKNTDHCGMAVVAD